MTQTAKKQISINAFYANTPGQNWIGLWSLPGSRASEYTNIDYWVDVARIAERGLFDSIFFADTNGVNDVYEGSARAAIERAAMFPMNDPLLLIPTMAYVTKHLSFGVTANLSYEPPYALARRFSTLDHLTKGRISWNIVTGFQDSAARAMGFDSQLDHDARYDLAEEYMEVVYKLWEGSWQDDAVVRDAANRIYARGDRVHEVSHQGKHFRMRGVHLSEPSPQRTPVLFQAGGSERGRAFAARHAECLFLNGLPSRKTAERIREVREQARAEGRDPRHIKFIMMATVVTAPTEAEARDKFEMLARHVDAEGMLAMRSGLSGIDLSKDLTPFRRGTAEGQRHRHNHRISPQGREIARTPEGLRSFRTAGRPRMFRRRLAQPGGGHAHFLDGGSRDRRLQHPTIRRTAAPDRFRRSRRAGIAGSRRLQDRLSRRQFQTQTVRRR